ncbi:MAG: hypothetical protein AAF518_08735 [Spirochaetota bacterium]
MQCKTFCGTDITRIEEEINNFLGKGNFDVKFVSQSQGESDYGHIYTISVWFAANEGKSSSIAQKVTASKKKAVGKPSKKKAVAKKKRAKKKS